MRLLPFISVTMRDGSAAAILDVKHPNSDLDPDPDLTEAASGEQNYFTEGVPDRDVWRNGCGQKLCNDFKTAEEIMKRRFGGKGPRHKVDYAQYLLGCCMALI
ncbi:uncharacterized protein [Coffea arabica]|uniref:Uncharacterized protein isoform X2 n=1 Tax=Coffea arabica TaxID=13443 RepID=A0ABM4WFF0_COFAR